jgi:DNA polymerase III delta subunit
MLYLLYGSDFDRVREKSHELEEKLLSKKPNASVFRFNAENFNQVELEELIKSQGLFENKYIVVLDRVFENIEAKDYVLKILKDLKASSHIFILLQGKLDKATLTRIEKQSEKVQEFEKGKEAKKEEFNIFSLTSALEKRDKRRLWILYQGARPRRAPEEIHGLLWWKVKTMLLTGRGGQFTIPELQKIASRLISIYHDAHRGLFEFDLALEKFILEI